MTTPIVRMYETEKQARNAVGKLREEGFSSDVIFLVTPRSKTDEGTAEPLPLALSAGFVQPQHASVYREGLRNGRSLVAIRAPFGQGRLATEVLDNAGPVAAGLELQDRRSVAWEVGAPFSSSLRLPVLLRNKPAPFSWLMVVQPLSRGLTFKGMRALSSPDFAAFGRVNLSDNPAPFSSAFNMRAVSAKKYPERESSFGMPFLTQDPTPFSSMLGMEAVTPSLATSEPAPFSRNVGFRTLSSGLSFLSRMFPALASPRLAIFGSNPLSDNAAPLSSMFNIGTISGKSGSQWTSSLGLPLLSKHGRPTSMGFPLLFKYPTPLSWLLRIPALSRFQ